MSTDRLIEDLARDLRPTSSLPAPWARAARWLLVAGGYVAALAFFTTSRADIAANSTHGWPFLVAQGAAVATAAASALAALASTVPGRSKRVLFLPIVMATVWFGSLATGAASEWRSPGAPSLAPAHEWLCLALIVFGGAPLWMMLVVMLRRGAPLTPRVTAALGAVAAVAVLNVPACISYPHPSSVTLLWHGSAMLAVAGLAASLGNKLTVSWAQRHFQSWQTATPRSSRASDG